MAKTGNNSRNPAFGTYGGAPTFAADLTEVAATAAAMIGENVATDTALPTSGNWPGRTVSVGDPVTEIYVWTSGGWLRVWSVGSAFASATDDVTVAASGPTTITFPAGRFTVPPIVQLQVVNAAGGVVGVPWILVAASASSVGVGIFTLGGAQVAGTISWTAVQMTPTTAAG